MFIFIWHIEFKSNKKELRSADKDFVIFWITKFSQGYENLFSFNSSWNIHTILIAFKIYIPGGSQLDNNEKYSSKNKHNE